MKYLTIIILGLSLVSCKVCKKFTYTEVLEVGGCGSSGYCGVMTIYGKQVVKAPVKGEYIRVCSEWSD